MQRRFPSRGASIATLLAATLSLGMGGTATAQPVEITTQDPAEAAAGWLTSQLGDDHVLETGFGPSVGATIDAVLSFDAVGVADDVAAEVAAAVAAQAETYASLVDEDPTDADTEVTTWTSGALGKLLVMAGSRPELDPHDLGGVDAIAELEAIECTTDRVNCDDGEIGAYKGLGAAAAESVSTFNQAYAIIGLVASDIAPSTEAIDFLIAQACDDGGYDFTLRGDDCSSAADTTGLVAQALLAVEADAAQDAISWLLDNQDSGGGFVGFVGVDASTTAFPVMALISAGEVDAATAGVQALADLQAGCDAPDDLVGAIYYNEPGDDGETDGDNVFATAQATPALAGTHLLEISGADSSNELPTLDCAPTDDPEEQPGDEPADDGAVGDGTDDADPDDGSGADGDDVGDDGNTESEDAQDVLPETGASPTTALVIGFLLLIGGLSLLRRHRTPRSVT